MTDTTVSVLRSIDHVTVPLASTTTHTLASINRMDGDPFIAPFPLYGVAVLFPGHFGQ
jgi:hypothetical protein